MKITTQITSTATMGDGSEVTLSRTVISTHGDNPAFQRREMASAVVGTADGFIEANALHGTRPL